MAETIEKMIVLSIKDKPESEYDCYVDVLTKNGTKRLLARGINKPESKNKANLMIGSISQIEYFKSRLTNSISRLKKATLLNEVDYSNPFNLVFVKKATNFLKNFQDPCQDVFKAYERILIFLNKGDKQEYLLTYLLGQSLNYFGIGINFSSCSECDTPSNLCDFKLYKGGFLCGEHKVEIRWTKELKSYYYLFNNLDIFLEQTSPEVNQILFTELVDYLTNNGIFINF
ncbi:DNA repair protein RecO [Mycoplasma sp. Mirounga ES2805-ORL]|uniref:DNA repair protein RecO n=1 Tax=Mycoplasma sp. Mirounga ES2805-ORL TaxID=754514 RepID=UPI00197BE31F|nr:DNA repair protein RecO [Mycoplasma sp. Mirounga ES2805-ORL]QSF13904.1 DNA repair protein RecO [Mycoplasma sp. Mirounga ES2805-ORL]